MGFLTLIFRWKVKVAYIYFLLPVSGGARLSPWPFISYAERTVAFQLITRRSIFPYSNNVADSNLTPVSRF